MGRFIRVDSCQIDNNLRQTERAYLSRTILFEAYEKKFVIIALQMI